jgi:hypothetical protein
LISFFLGIPDVLKEQMLPIKKQYKSKKLEKRSGTGEGQEPGSRPRGEEEEVSAAKQLEVNEIGNGQELELEDQRNQTTSQGSASSDQEGQENTIGLEGFDADDELRKIAEDGRDWKLRHLRQEDMEVGFLGLLSFCRLGIASG